MGNAVNLAARLEGVNKYYRTCGILISEYTKNETGDEFICRSLDRVRVVGISTPLRLYEITGFRGESSAADIEKLAAWEDAIRLFEGGQFAKAEEVFSSLSTDDADDATAKLYLERCRQFVTYPPPGDWDGVNNLTEK
jgi:adenylate cyclase